VLQIAQGARRHDDTPGPDGLFSRAQWASKISLDNIRYNDYRWIVKETNTPRRAKSLEEDACVDLVRTADMLSRRPAQVLKAEDLSGTQYNVLRILRGSPEGLSCGEIGSRMITRDPDITRLLDRLEKRGLISRCRETKDRRSVLGRITAEGLVLLARIDRPMIEVHRDQLGHLGEKRLGELRDLLKACRDRLG
jgi:DNA-binding MarR family transcriptional regulator